MTFRRTLQRYGRTPEPVTPFQKAGQVWDERIGSARVQARNWRLIAFGCLAMSSGLAAGLLWQSAQSRVAPYVVEVDRLGEARAVAPADGDYRPTDPQIAWHLGRFISNVRSVSIDPVLVRENWLAAYDFATDRASVFLGEYARANDPFADIGDRSVAVQITSVVRASDDSFQVKWIEQTFERGSLARTERWTAMLTVTVRPPRNADVLRRNPLGLYVKGIDWSRELEPPTPAARPPAREQAPAPPLNIPSGSPLQGPATVPGAAPVPGPQGE
jgi:type IV secretion system protein VirB5